MRLKAAVSKMPPTIIKLAAVLKAEGYKIGATYHNEGPEVSGYIIQYFRGKHETVFISVQEPKEKAMQPEQARMSIDISANAQELKKLFRHRKRGCPRRKTRAAFFKFP